MLIALLMIASCNPDLAKTPEPVEEEIEVLIPRFISETEIGSRYIDITGDEVRAYYCMTSPLITGFEKRNHSFSNGKLELASEVLGRKIIQTIDKDADGNIVYDVHDEKGDSFVFTMVYNRKTKTFDYKQALLYTCKIRETSEGQGVYQHVMSTNEGLDINVTPQGYYYGQIKMRALFNYDGNDSSSILESDAFFIESNKDMSVSVNYGYTSQTVIPSLTWKDEIWIKTDPITFVKINSLLDSYKNKVDSSPVPSGNSYGYGVYLKNNDSYIRTDTDPYYDDNMTIEDNIKAFLTRNKLTYILTMVEGK